MRRATTSTAQRDVSRYSHVRRDGHANIAGGIVRERAAEQRATESRPWVRGPFQPRDRSTESVQVYKFWCYYWGLRLLTRLCGPRGGLFELLFPPLSPSASSRSRLPFLTPVSFLSTSPSSSWSSSSYSSCTSSFSSSFSSSSSSSSSSSLFHLRRPVLVFSSAMPHRPCPVCFSSRRLPFAKRTLNYAADDKYLSRPLRERPTRTRVEFGGRYYLFLPDIRFLRDIVLLRERDSRAIVPLHRAHRAHRCTGGRAVATRLEICGTKKNLEPESIIRDIAVRDRARGL